jgi:ribosomal protein S18 acetylase RimI-like enzyme
VKGEVRDNRVNVMDNGQSGGASLLIRDARSEELDEVSLLMRDAYLEYRDSFPPERWKSYLENIMDVRGRLSVSELIVAELRGKVVGAVTLYLDGSRSLQEEWPPGWAGIRLLAVHPAFRSQGIGRALMVECICRCQKKHIKTIGLHTASIMNIARKMYEGMGFVRAPEYDFHPRPGTVVMAYCLSPSSSCGEGGENQ